MKLLNLYVENFGCLSQYELDFQAGLTVLYEENGFGKTTLAEFIRAMLYGFPRAAKTLDKNRRKKYLPWNGGKYGGNLSFESEGGRYRVERTFGATPKGDTFRLIDLTTNKSSNRYSENLGLELFALDSDSFERSTYLPQLRDEGGFDTDRLRAKLGDLVEDTNDINNFEKAVTALKSKRSKLIPYRNGSGGSVAQAQSQVTQIQEALELTRQQQGQMEQARQNVAELEKSGTQLQQELEQLRRQIRQAAQYEKEELLRHQYDQLLERQRQAEAHCGDFPNGGPSQHEFALAQERWTAYLNAQTAARLVGLSQEEAEQLRVLEETFSGGVPEEETIERWSRQARVLEAQKLAEAGRGLPEQEQRQLERLERIFASGVPSDGQLAQFREKKERAELLCRDNQKSGNRSVGVIASMIAGLMLGILAWVLQQPMLLAGMGCAALLIVFFWNRQHKARKQTLEARREAERLASEVAMFEGRYGMTLASLQAECAAYRVLLQREQTLDADHTRRQLEHEKEYRVLLSELEPYCDTVADAERAIAQLREKSRQFRQLQEKQLTVARRRGEIQQQIAELEERISAFLAPYVEPDPRCFQTQLTQLRRAWEEHCSWCERLDQIRKEIAQFLQEHGPVPDCAEMPDRGALEAKEQELALKQSRQMEQMLEQKNLMEQMRSQLARIPELQDQLAYWQREKIEGQSNAAILDETVSYLTQARERLSGNYLGTVQKRFDAYQARLGSEEKAMVNSDLEVGLERQGQTRELGYFSAGQRDLLMLCMRFALVDALFTGEKPMIILDDPFVNLDDAHTLAARKMLDVLAKDRQILYLVCNKSRV